MRKEFELTDEQFAELKEASQPTPAMWLSGGQPMFDTPQENANRFWKKLSTELGFKWDSAEAGKDARHFTAEVAEKP